MRSLRRVLVHHPYGIGDLLFLTPALRALRLIPTVEKVDLLLGSRTEAVVRSNPHGDEIFTMDKNLFHEIGKWKTLQEVSRLLKILRRNQYDLLLDYSGRGEIGCLSAVFLNIPRRAGFDYKGRGRFHNIRLPIPEGFKGRHAVDYYSDLAERAGVPVEDRFLEFYLTPEDHASAEAMLDSSGISKESSWIVAAPGGGASWGKDADFKQWPVDSFAAFVNQLAKRIAFDRVLIVGSEGERDLGDRLQTKLQGPSLNLAGRANIRTAMALIQRSKLVVANDGGIVHLTHSLRKPVLAFYGPVDPNVYGPYPPSENAVPLYHETLECRPCYQNFRYNSACVGRECLRDLMPDQVMEKLERFRFFEKLTEGVTP